VEASTRVLTIERKLKKSGNIVFRRFLEGEVKMMKLLQWMLSTVLNCINWFYGYMNQLIRQRTGIVITLDTGRRVVIGKQIAEGGFSFVFEAYDVAASGSTTKLNQPQRYALKRIHCPDSELLDHCRYEASVHRAAMQYPHILPLYGFAIVQNDCYMLFPLCTESLRDKVNRQNPFLQKQQYHAVLPSTSSPPFPEVTALALFRQICLGVQALHNCGYTHRDIKPENVLVLQKQQPVSFSSYEDHQLVNLVLMDFGSAGPVEQSIQTRRQVLEIVEQASQHTTMPYRPPELFEGGVSLRHNSDANVTQLDYRAVDVWSLGCTLFAILYGASPFEIEFALPMHQQRGGGGSSNGGTIKIVECTHLSILGSIPTPKFPPISLWYSESIDTELIRPMLSQDPQRRPKLAEVIHTTEAMICRQGGTIVDMAAVSATKTTSQDHRPFRDEYNDGSDENYDTDGVALLSRVV
jgi:serine/threonine kinase 16